MENSKRIICLQCLRATRACICACVQRVDSETEILILQHPAEVNHIKGSARLLHLCLPHSSILVGEQFAENQLQGILTKDHKTNVLLYPDSAVIGLPIAQKFSPDPHVAIRLILLDASWRHSKQMLLQNPILQSLPRIALREVPASRYQIRHAYADDQLSTLEACAYALMQLESSGDKFMPLLRAFDSFNRMQIDFGVNKLLRIKK
ncbi:tRNA-uridine aminocarboxypropyltransferase [Undibacterium sp.]|uniref:tRNA-uridine aminocarboxypropyltransferase n=1 Tax=Undibacterium sp. TaxID=1914977 RepID=UPI003753048F